MRDESRSTGHILLILVTVPILLCIGVFGYVVLSDRIFGYRVDLSAPSVRYINDSGEPIALYECIDGCDKLGNTYYIDPGESVEFVPNPDHKLPLAVLFESPNGITLGCSAIEQVPHGINYEARVSNWSSCDTY